MIDPPAPQSWTQFPIECLWYLAKMGPLHLGVLAVWAFVGAAVSATRGTPRTVRVAPAALFLAALLICGALANGLWGCLIWGRLYISADYVSDFNPIWPISRGVIDREFSGIRGQLLGASLGQLKLVWCVFAAATWISAIVLFRTLSQRFPQRSPMPGDLSEAQRPVPPHSC